MRCTETLKTHVSPEMKLQAKSVADREFLSEAAWLKRLVMREIRARNDVSGAESDLLLLESIPGPTSAAPGNSGAGKPMLVRLTVEDRLLLDARAAARYRAACDRLPTHLFCSDRICASSRHYRRTNFLRSSAASLSWDRLAGTLIRSRGR